jgi:hypothetical protein
MKTFAQLTKDQKNKAVSHYANLIIEEIAEGHIRFNKNLQARIDKAWKKAQAMQTPWFIGEYIMDTCAPEINGIAMNQAEDALYPEKNETVCLIQIA